MASDGHPAFPAVGIGGGSSVGVKRLKQSSADVKKEWSCAYTPPPHSQLHHHSGHINNRDFTRKIWKNFLPCVESNSKTSSEIYRGSSCQ